VTFGKSTVPPRVVVVTRRSDLDQLLLRHGTRAQARFFLESRGQRLEDVVERHDVQAAALHTVQAAVPLSWRRARVTRADLDRFLFEPDDVVVAVGQDGLVANVAKYLHGQPVVGVNPAPDLFAGVLVRHAPSTVAAVLEALRDGRACEQRTMVEASTTDGQRLLALNEIFVGHRSHQSARYRLRFGAREERHSSSGLIVCSGTGSTGWARSVCLHRSSGVTLPEPLSTSLAFLVREPWPSATTGTDLIDGRFDATHEGLCITSEMNEGGVAFGDGIEGDALELPFGQVLTVRPSATPLLLA
jgi:hypothetical protein